MPEGAEVRIIAEELNEYLKNKNLILIEVLGGRYKKHGNPAGMNDFLKTLPAKVKEVKWKGKLIYFVFDNGWYMLNTLGMSGGWTPNKEKHSNVSFTFEKPPNNIYFRDMRNFGTIKFINGEKNLNDKLSKIGPDMLNDSTTFDIFKKNMKKKINENKPISQILMDQKHVSGVGNYIKSESLYISKISPHRKLKDINEDELKSLFNAIKKVIISSYKSQGMSLRDYKDFEDKPGEYQFKLVVYGRKFDDLGNKVKTETTKDKRTTHWVPEVQT